MDSPKPSLAKATAIAVALFAPFSLLLARLPLHLAVLGASVLAPALMAIGWRIAKRGFEPR